MPLRNFCSDFSIEYKKNVENDLEPAENRLLAIRQESSFLGSVPSVSDINEKMQHPASSSRHQLLGEKSIWQMYPGYFRRGRAKEIGKARKVLAKVHRRPKIMQFTLDEIS